MTGAPTSGRAAGAAESAGVAGAAGATGAAGAGVAPGAGVASGAFGAASAPAAPAAPAARAEPVEIVCVGAGPGAAMLLERLIANHAAESPELPLRVRLVDPHRPAGGRIWRRDQSPLLKLNSMLRDVAFFTDQSCTIAGPIAPGHSLAEWVREVRAGRIARPEWADAALDREIAEIAEDEFPTRRLNHGYLAWAHAETLRRAADTVAVSWVADTAVAVEESAAGGAGGAGGAGRHLVRLASGEALAADLVVYALGHNGTEPSADAARLAEFAGRHGLRYVPPAFTADVDLSWVPPGADVIVRGMGLAAIDLSVMLAEGRGGRFAPRPDGTLGYEPSGREPVLHFGSRRGVPYRSKITSQLVGDPVELEYLGRDFQAGVAARTEPLDFERDVWPLIAAELVTGYYRELFTGHPERVRGSWAAFAPRLRSVLGGSGAPGRPGRAGAPGGPGTPTGPNAAALARLIRTHVPDPADRFDLAAFDRPLAFAPDGAGTGPGTGAGLGADAEAGAHELAGGADDVQRRVIAHIAEDLRLRTSQQHSATQALFLTGLYAFLALAEIQPERWNARSRTTALPRRWFSYFSYLASGPPGHRLQELIALAEAGVVRFLGGDVELIADEARGVFTASGTAVVAARAADGGAVALAAAGGPGPGAAEPAAPRTARASATAKILIDAWLPEARAATSDNPLLRQLVASGRLRELAVRDGAAVASTGEVEVAHDGSVPGAPGQFALGPFVAGLTGGAFTRPGLNSLPFRTHDRCARAILAAAAAGAGAAGVGAGVAGAGVGADSVPDPVSRPNVTRPELARR
ncbi:FAD/NAD(P)-binding protein [Leucobacter luti]|uniref:FAD-NAD(P)-binding protein n=1 Tax=Leucobacter luti TaxID=340320 RepID=A0A4V6MD51_9MICO|nr:FAD/NAD(P)-binding protein [Leucobacter luti]MBL3699339.1 hypothetical protein [Leucobacter luti]RZT66849.1 FAD-NAD(P)-binding protein [Leucobacter luti]